MCGFSQSFTQGFSQSFTHPRDLLFKFLAASLLPGKDQPVRLMERTVVGPVETRGKRFLLSKLLWESAMCADSHQQRQFPQAFRFPFPWSPP